MVRDAAAAEGRRLHPDLRQNEGERQLCPDGNQGVVSVNTSCKFLLLQFISLITANVNA